MRKSHALARQGAGRIGLLCFYGGVQPESGKSPGIWKNIQRKRL
jgi:hypothetical protein